MPTPHSDPHWQPIEFKPNADLGGLAAEMSKELKVLLSTGNAEPKDDNPNPNAKPNSEAFRNADGVTIKSSFGVMRLGLASQAFSWNPTLPDSIPRWNVSQNSISNPDPNPP